MSITARIAPSDFKTGISRRSTGVAALLAAALLVSGCATPTGQSFSDYVSPPEGKAHIYLYRKSALYASGQAFSVKLNQKEEGELLNGSYILWVVAPGDHLVNVKPGAFGSTYEYTAKLGNKQTQYLEFAAPPFLLGNAFHAGSSIAVRTPQQATADLMGLKAVK